MHRSVTQGLSWHATMAVQDPQTRAVATRIAPNNILEPATILLKPSRQ